MVTVKYDGLTWKGRPLNQMSYEELVKTLEDCKASEELMSQSEYDAYLLAIHAELACLKLEKRVILVDNFKECAPLSRAKVVKIAEFSNAIVQGIFQTHTKHKFKILC